jgi:hypothetical protein
MLTSPDLGNPKNNTLSCMFSILLIAIYKEKTWFNETRSNLCDNTRKDKYHCPLC